MHRVKYRRLETWGTGKGMEPTSGKERRKMRTCRKWRMLQEMEVTVMRRNQKRRTKEWTEESQRRPGQGSSLWRRTKVFLVSWGRWQPGSLSSKQVHGGGCCKDQSLQEIQKSERKQQLWSKTPPGTYRREASSFPMPFSCFLPTLAQSDMLRAENLLSEVPTCHLSLPYLALLLLGNEIQNQVCTQWLEFDRAQQGWLRGWKAQLFPQASVLHQVVL